MNRLRSAVRITVVSVLAVLLLAPTTVAAGSAEPSDDGGAGQQLVERFAPLFKLKEQTEPCSTDGEAYRPTSVDILLDNPEIALRQVSRGDPVVKHAPSSADLFGLGEGFFLDFPGNSLIPSCIYERDFWKYTDDGPASVYAHIVQQPDAPNQLVVQYWSYWYYNDWNNKHESDWEGIMLLFEASSVEEALDSEPVMVGYAQHEGGERADWSDNKLERLGDHPVVYSSAGSHASYFDSAIYLGRSASEGFGCDETDGISRSVEPEVILLPDSVENPTDDFAWLAYEGRWGERQSGAFNGPTGPAVKERWLEPLPWFDDLRASSVVIPTGDSDANGIIGLFCSVVERGSTALISFKISPTRMVISIVVALWLLSWLVGRTDWGEVPLTPLRRRRRIGQIIRAAVRTYRGAPLAFMAFGLVYIPAAIVTGTISGLIRLIPLVGNFMDLSGPTSGTNIFLAALASSAASVAAFVVVNSMVAVYLDSEREGESSVKSSAQLVWGKRSQLLGAFIRSYAIAGTLIATVVGAPWGIRQLVRYQFVAQAVMLEDETGHEALNRSSEIVRGRWWHTGLMTAVVNGMVVVVAGTVGLLVLLAVTGLPLWAFSVIISLVNALVVPLAAIAMCMLYGDAVAEVAEPADTELVDID